MSRSLDFIEKIKNYRDRSSSARQVEEEALLAAMEAMNDIMGDLHAFKSCNTPLFPVNIHDVSYSIDVNQFDDFSHGVRILVQRDENKISKISVLTRTSNFEEEKIVTISPRRVDGVKCWKDETYRRNGEGVETRAQEVVYNSADHAAQMLRRSVLTDVVHELSYGHAFISRQLPSDDKETAAIVSDIIAYASEVGRDIERNRRVQKDERMRTSLALKGVWSMAEQDLAFLSDLGYEFDNLEREHSINAVSDGSSIMINVGHAFGYQSTIKIAAMDNEPDVVLVSLSDNEGRDEVIGQHRIADSSNIKNVIVDTVLSEIEAAEKIWVPDIETDYVHAPQM